MTSVPVAWHWAPGACGFTLGSCSASSRSSSHPPYTYTHAYIHTHIHTYIHTCIYIYVCVSTHIIQKYTHTYLIYHQSSESQFRYVSKYIQMLYTYIHIYMFVCVYTLICMYNFLLHPPSNSQERLESSDGRLEGAQRNVALSCTYVPWKIYLSIYIYVNTSKC